MIWEGPEALEDCGSDVETLVPKTVKSKKPTITVTTKSLPPPPPPPPSSSEESDGGDESGDEYVAEKEKSKDVEKGKVIPNHLPYPKKSCYSRFLLCFQRRLRQIPSSGSESDFASDEEATRTKRRTRQRVSRSRTPVSPVVSSAKSRLKRKQSTAETQPPNKRKKSDTATEDPVRKYCLGKLEDVFRDVFFRYPHVREDKTIVKTEGEGEGQELNEEKKSVGGIVPKKLEEMTEEEKEALMNESKRFTAELERCMFDIYSEPDKSGAPHAGAKYK